MADSKLQNPSPDPRRVEQQFALHISAVRARIVQRLGKGAADVDDLVQQALTRGLDCAASIVDPDAVRPWLLTIAERTVFDYLRAHRRQPRFDELPSHGDREDATSRSADQVAEDLEFWQIVVRLLEGLPAALRESGRRHFIVGDSIGAISRALGQSKSTVQDHVRRAREALASRLSQSGYAAFVPLLDVAQRPPAAVLGEPSASGASTVRRFTWGGLAAVAVVVVGWVLMDASDGNASPAASSVNTVVADASDVVCAAGREPRLDVVSKRTEVRASVSIHGRVVDAVTGAPIESARVRAFDYLPLQECEARTDANGEFCIEESRGVGHPFDVYVEPPLGSKLGRVCLDAIVPTVAPVEVRMQESVTVSLTATMVGEDGDHAEFLSDVEVMVVDLSTKWGGSDPDPDGGRHPSRRRSDPVPVPGDDWPAGKVGYDLRQLLPPHYTVLARRFFSGPLDRVDLPGVSRTTLGFMFLTGDGRLWFGMTNSVRSKQQPADRLAARVAVKFGVCSTPASQVAHRQPSSRSLRRWTYPTCDFMQLHADPNSIDYWACVSHASLAAWLDGAEQVDGALDSPRSLEDFAQECSTQFEAGALGRATPASDTPEQVRVRMDLGSIAALSGRPSDARFPVVLSHPADEPGGMIIGCDALRTSDAATFDGVAKAQPLVLEVLSPDFSTVLHRVLFAAPESVQGIYDLTESSRHVTVAVRDRKGPLADVEVEAFFGSDHPSASATDLSRWFARTDEAGETRFSIAGVGRCDIRVSKSVPSGFVELTESQVTTVGADAHCAYDFGAGFTLCIRNSDGIGPFSAEDGDELDVEGEVIGERRVAFKQRVDACEDGIIVVHPGLVGEVTGRVVLRDANKASTASPASPTNPWDELPEYLPFRTRSDQLESKRTTVELVPVRDRTMPLAVMSLRLVDADGASLEPATMALEVAIRATRERAGTSGSPPLWSSVEWRELHGAVVIEGQEPMTGVELRMLAKDRVPVYARIPSANPDGTRSLMIRLARGREVMAWVSSDRANEEDRRGDSIRFGLRNGDVFVAVGDQPVSSETELHAALALVDNDQPLELHVRRNGKNETISVPSPWRSFLDELRFVMR